MPNFASRFLAALIVSAGVAGAQEKTPPEPVPGSAPAATAPAAPDTAAIVLAPPQRDYSPPSHVDSDGEARTLSPGLAAALSYGMPKYTPPTPTPTQPAEPIDMRDIDKPKNEIKRLPAYVVRETRPPVFRNRDLYSHDGLAGLAFKTHGGLVFGNILGLNSGPAYDMYLEDQRKADMEDLSDMAHAMSRGGDSAEGSYILQQSSDTYMRQGGTWDWSGQGIVGGNTGGGGK
jgi:hypothetical protein